MRGSSIFQYVYDEGGEVVDREYMDVNLEALRINGRKREELIEGPFAQVHGRKDAEQYIPAIRGARGSGKLVTVESYFGPRDIYLISWVIPLTEQMFMTSSLDITAIKRAQRMAEEERSRLQVVLDTAPVGIVITDPSGRMVVMNDALREIWGMDAPMSEASTIITSTRVSGRMERGTAGRIGPSRGPLTAGRRSSVRSSI